MTKKHAPVEPAEGKGRVTRSHKCRRAVAAQIARTAALRGRNMADVAEPFLRKLAADVDKRMRSGGLVGGPVIAAGSVPEDEVSSINMWPETANLISRLAGANGVTVAVVLDDPTFRDAVLAEYMAALIDSLAELGWDARPRRR